MSLDVIFIYKTAPLVTDLLITFVFCACNVDTFLLLHSSFPSSIVITTYPIMSSLDAEEQQYLTEVEEVKMWWTDSRWRYTKRPFTAEQIVAKRGNLRIEYPSNVQSKKLWKLVESRWKV
jgi:hypothetical protein